MLKIIFVYLVIILNRNTGLFSCISFFQELHGKYGICNRGCLILRQCKPFEQLKTIIASCLIGQGHEPLEGSCAVSKHLEGELVVPFVRFVDDLVKVFCGEFCWVVDAACVPA